MSIVIRRAGDLYEARVRPPHGRGVPWDSDWPMPAEELVAALLGRGCHQTDIGDAFDEADPDWMSRGRPYAEDE
jgi:hypothetical protein